MSKAASIAVYGRGVPRLSEAEFDEVLRIMFRWLPKPGFKA